MKFLHQADEVQARALQVWPVVTVVVLEPLIILIKILELFMKLSWLVFFISAALLPWPPTSRGWASPSFFFFVQC